MVRAKFTCNKVEKCVGHSGHEFVYNASLYPVVSGSEENKSFFAATPGGSITLSTVKDDLFQPGKSYYVDFQQAD